MAGGRKRDFKAEYARRIANASAKGKTRQQARGHVAREHVFRKEREIEREGISSQQLQAVRHWYSTQFNPMDIKFQPEDEELIEWVKQNGYEEFQNYRRVWNAERRRYRKEGETGEGWSHLVALGIAARAPDERWMYYH